MHLQCHKLQQGHVLPLVRTSWAVTARPCRPMQLRVAAGMHIAPWCAPAATKPWRLNRRYTVPPANAASLTGATQPVTRTIHHSHPPFIDLPRAALLRVVAPTALALLLCNMDRICLSVAILPMSQEFGWPASMQGLIQSAFLWGYMATQLLGGSLADRYGGKVVMAAGIAWFSVASMLLPAALSGPVAAAGLTVPAVLLARCCVGLGEGVALPSMNNLVATHISPAAKSRALGMCFTGFHCGNLAGLLLSPMLLMAFGWRALFLVFGLLGAPLLALWLRAVPDAPGAHVAGGQSAANVISKAASSDNTGGSSGSGDGVTQGASSSSSGASSSASSSSSSSRDGAGGASGTSSSGQGGSSDRSAMSLLRSPATWAIIIVNFVNHWGYFIYLNWMPTYFVKALGFDLRSSSLLSFLPWLVMATGSSASGFLADGLIKRGVQVTTVRKALQTVAFVVPAAALLLLATPGISPALAVAAMTMALGVTSLGQAGFVANMSDIAPTRAGQMFGLCNTFGSAAGILGVVAVGLVVDATGSFAPVFQLTAAMYLVAVLAWNLLCTGDRVFD